MCHVHTNEELANILENLADLFTWKRRKSLVDAAAVLRSPGREWRHPAMPDVPFENGYVHPMDISGSASKQPA
jgi:hypothetical protein